ncbi:peroxidase family protein [Methylobacterium sp. JK268]
MPDKTLLIGATAAFLLMMAVAVACAWLQAGAAAEWLAAGNPPIPTTLWKGPSRPDLAYFLTVDAAIVMTLLLIPAIGLHLLRRAGDPGPAWLVVWTLALLAFLIHAAIGTAGVLPGLRGVFDDPVRPPRLHHPVASSLLALWWGLDVVFAWRLRKPGPVAQVVRGILHALVLGAALTVTLVVSGRDAVRAAGLLLLAGTLAAVAYRIVVRPFDPASVSGRAYVGAFEALNRVVPWYRLPTPLAVLNLAGLREVLRRDNLHDTSSIPVTNPAGLSAPHTLAPADLVQRNLDGYFNDLAKPAMGSASDPALADHESMHFTVSNPGARFGRNVPLAEAFPEDEQALLTPNPRLISNELLARRDLIEATSLNVLAAAWIQFQTHDWFNHGEPPAEDPFRIDVAPGDPWGAETMAVRRTRPDPTRDYAAERAANGGRLRDPPTYANAESHWWDASQIYGSNRETTARLRSDYRIVDGRPVPTGEALPDGKLYLPEGDLILDPASLDPNERALTGFSGNWWAGLSLLHTLFAREHNAICDHLRPLYPGWDSDRLFGTARMINSALMAKIHTVEWTPAILSMPAIETVMTTNWWGLQGERLQRALGRIGDNEGFSGIPLSGVNHHGADYCLTEEFVSVYRLHPLMRDDLTIRSAATGADLARIAMMDGLVGNLDQLTVFRDPRWGFADVLYSFGVSHPGAVTLHNYPDFLRALVRPDGERVDLATIDILRDRERGVPRYNRFRELFHKAPIRSFDELENPLHPRLPEALRRIYGQTAGRDNVDRLDLMVGLFAEVVPPGFGFSDTAFRVFVLMASRRLKSDRFIARDFVPEVYTQEGIAWVNGNSFAGLIRRHFPELAPALYGVENGFKPWRRIGSA